MKNSSLLVVSLSAVLLAAANLSAAEAGGLQIQLQPGANPAGGLRAGNLGAPQGQNPFGAGKSAAAWYIENLEKTVTLTPPQKEAVTKIIETRDKAVQEFQAKNADKLQAALKAMTDAYQSKDKDAIAKAQKDYQGIGGETTRLYHQAQTDLENVLTPEQKAKRQEAATAQMIKSLTEPAVLTEEQLGRIKAIIAKASPGGERLERESYQAIQDVLTAEQKAGVAKHRALANAKAAFGRANLTAEQWQKVEAAYDDLAKTPNLGSEAVTKQLAERVNGLLTAEQKEAMKKGGWGGLAVGASPGQAAQRAPGSPQIITLGESGDGVSITLNGAAQVSPQIVPQGGALGAPGRTVWIGEGRGHTEKGAWLGITTEPVSEPLRAQLSLAKEEGLLVEQVVPGSPAAAAGLAQNDVLLRLDDQILVELSQLRKLIAMKKAGDHVKLVFLRKAVRQEATATLAEHEIEAPERVGSQWLQAAPGQIIQLGEGNRALQENLERAQQRRVGESRSATATAPGAVLNPNPWRRETAEGNLEQLRKQLESSNLAGEPREKIRQSIEQAKEATEKARAALNEALKEASNLSLGGFAKPVDPLNPAPPKPAPKKPGE